MSTRRTQRALVGLTALGAMAALGGCDAGVYETDVMSPAMIVQTNTETGEIRACAVVRAIEAAAVSARQSARALEQGDVARMSDNELQRREQAILQREQADREAHPVAVQSVGVTEHQLVECTEWTARG